MKQKLAQLAISAALRRDWENALEYNQAILQLWPADVDALNRLARAYFELGNPKKAFETAKSALKIDPLNPIALKCQEKYEECDSQSGNLELEEDNRDGLTCERIMHEHFLEEPGKTKVVSLLNLGEWNLISTLSSGQVVQITPGKHRVSVCTIRGKYIGRLPDDLSKRLIELMHFGNQYSVWVKSLNKTTVRVMIKETKRTKKTSNYVSFPVERT